MSASKGCPRRQSQRAVRGYGSHGKKKDLRISESGNDCPCREIIFAQSAGLLLKGNQIRLARQVHIYESLRELEKRCGKAQVYLLKKFNQMGPKGREHVRSLHCGPAKLDPWQEMGQTLRALA